MNSSEIRTQLEECFAVVFPDLPADDIAGATMQNVAQWDSLAMLTLVSVVEESCGAKIDLDDLPQLVSFEKMAEYLERSTLSDRLAA